MTRSQTWRSIISSEITILILIALARIALHTLTNNNYGFHRDELTTLDDARHLAWGYVVYPPLTPFLGRIGMEIFGSTPAGVRFISALAQGIALVLAGLIARELGGKRWAQIIAGCSIAIAPVSVAQGALFQYVSFDYLWWVLLAYLVVRLIKTDNPRWWLAIGAVIGIGMMTKFTLGFYAAGIVAAVLLTPLRRQLRSPWLWAGVGVSLLVFMPNLIWQIQHSFVTLEFLGAIHARDISIGRTSSFISDQFLLGANPFTIPLWIAGLWFYFISRQGRQYRALGWMYAVSLALFIVAQGRGYYEAAAYPMLLAAGAVCVEQWIGGLSKTWSRIVRGTAWAGLAAGGALIGVLAMPLVPINTTLWNTLSSMNTDLREEIGWPEMVQTLATIRDGLPESERAGAVVMAGNTGEAGAVNLYGPAYGLPPALIANDSYWLRGYDGPTPQSYIVIGYSLDTANQFFKTCIVAGQNINPYGVRNEESNNPDILVCRELLYSWPDFWARIKHFG